MKEKLLLLLKKEKKAISLEKLLEKANVESLEDREEFLSALNEGLKDFSIIKTSKDRFILLEKTSFRIGRFFASRNGDGKVSVTYSYEKNGKTYSKSNLYDIDSNHTNGAIDGDVILVNLYSEHRNSPLKGSVHDIVKRDLHSVVGKVFKIGKSYYIKPLDKRKNFIVKISDYAVEGSKVAVDITGSIGEREFVGSISRVFHHKFDPSEDILLEAFKCGVDYEFSKATLEEAKKLPMEVLDTDLIGRVDLRNMEIFTIDGADTKDIDDALSCQRLENGNYLVGVHIADVSHYVKPHSAIEADAFKRGTSVYLAGKVIPMLPCELSNGICSLNPDVDRLALSCLMEVNPNGQVVHHDIVKSVIHSNKKMTYDQVNHILHNESYDSSYDSFVPTLKILNGLALKLKSNRKKSGALSFNRPELYLRMDENDKVTGITVRREDYAENLIEEFMLLANETVDKLLVSHNIPCLHRIHDYPNEERMEEFFRLLHALGNDYHKSDYVTCSTNPHALQELEEFVRNSGRLSNVLSTNLVKCMSRAKYSPDNIGHFGLAKDYYCHFTSPIRRYPDLTIHRLLKSELEHTSARDIISKLSDIGIQSSKMERIAQEAEDKTLRMRVAEYMSSFIGNEFTGIITGVSDHGMDVELDNSIEARIKMKDIDGDYYYSESDFSLISLSGKEDYSVGDVLKMQLIRSDKQDKSIEMKPIEKISTMKKHENKVLKKRRSSSL